MVTFDISITGKDMFDYNVYHNYRHFQGIISLLLGIAMLILCVAAYIQDGNISYILITGFLGIYFTILTPVKIYFKSYTQVKMTPSFMKPIKYTLSEELLLIEQDGAKAEIPMSDIIKVRDTGKSIVLYVSAVRAYILPKKQLEGKLDLVKDIINKSQAKNIKL